MCDKFYGLVFDEVEDQFLLTYLFFYEKSIHGYALQ